MNSAPVFTTPTAFVASIERDLDECEVLLRRAIEMVRGAMHGPQPKTSNAENAVGAAELGSSEPIRPLALPRQVRARYSIGRILLTLLVLAVTGFMVLVLLGLKVSMETLGVISEPKWAHQSALRFEALAPALGFQHGLKLVGMATMGSSNHGMSVALSADGNTAIVGAPGPNNADRNKSPSAEPAGVAWVFTHTGGTWSKQPNKLVGSSNESGGGLWSQGTAVAVSADGNTAIVGGPSDNRTTGAAWVFTRNGGVWTQQGDKLVGTYRPGESALPLGQGMSVALSGDGNTAIIGGWRTEGAWVFTRSGGVWKQQGNKLVGTDAAGARQGMSVALSGDGNTAIVGGWSDNHKTGAAWVFIRKNGVWTQQGKKFVGASAEGSAHQSTSVALSADGDTAIVGGPGDNRSSRSVPYGLGAAGAAWVFTRRGGVWRQQGDKLVSNSGARQGASVALSADGNSALVGGLSDDGGLGAASLFTRGGDQWMQSKKLVGTGAMTVSAVALSSDGSIAVIGASNETGGVGASWVFARTSQ
jgi:hypothetical protein